MSLWLQRVIALFTAAHSDAYKLGLEDARNICAQVAMRRHSPVMDDATLAAWRDCADHIAGRLGDLLAARDGLSEAGRPGSERQSGSVDLSLLLFWIVVGAGTVWFWHEAYNYGRALVAWSFVAR